jgi:hypothetical protein
MMPLIIDIIHRYLSYQLLLQVVIHNKCFIHRAIPLSSKMPRYPMVLRTLKIGLRPVVLSNGNLTALTYSKRLQRTFCRFSLGRQQSGGSSWSGG